MKYFTSDLEFNSKTLAEKRGFSSAQEMNEYILDSIFTHMRRGDHLYILGNLAVGENEKVAEILDKFKFEKIHLHLIMGDKDKRANNGIHHYFDSVNFVKTVKIHTVRTILHHYPMVIWPGSDHNSWLLYGHLGKNELGSYIEDNFIFGKSLNVHAELHDYTPLSEDEVYILLEEALDNVDFNFIKKRKNR